MKRHTILSVILLGSSNLAHADEVLTAQERTAFSLLESVTDIVSARIDASTCYDLQGQYHMTLFATGQGGDRRQNNMATVELPNQVVTVVGYPKSIVSGVGAMILAGYSFTPSYNDFDYLVNNYSATYAFDSTSESLSMASDIQLRNPYLVTQLLSRTEAITSFSRSALSDPQDGYATNVGWGMSGLSKSGYGKSKYWQRFKISRDDGTNAETILVTDLLAYRQSCRIKINMSGHNSADNISQEGYLTIDMSNPYDPVGVSFD